MAVFAETCKGKFHKKRFDRLCRDFWGRIIFPVRLNKTVDKSNGMRYDKIVQGVNRRSQGMYPSREEKKTLELLAAQSRVGDEGAFVRLFTQLDPLLKNRAFRYASEYGGETEDLMQEGAIGLLRAVKSYREDSATPFIAFAAVCVENSIRSAVRRSNREKRRIPADTVSVDDLPEHIPDTTVQANPERALLEQSARAEILQAASEELTALEMRVLVEYTKGSSYGEIAQKLQISAKAVDNSMQRIRKKLRNALAK